METKKEFEERAEVTNEERRNFLKGAGLAAGGAVIGAAGAGLMGPDVSNGMAEVGLGVKSAQAAVKMSDVYKQFGKYIFLMPGKFTGTVAAVDLSTGLTLAWLSGWNYGDTSPIMHHMAAFPSPDPYKGFEFIVNTQGGKNLYIYGIPTTVKQPGEGFRIYKMRYDGTKRRDWASACMSSRRRTRPASRSPTARRTSSPSSTESPKPSVRRGSSTGSPTTRSSSAPGSTAAPSP